MHNTISYLIMGKDELDYFLKESIKSAEEFVDEIIYIDTGSNDNSIQWITENCKNTKVYYYKWPGWERSNKVRNFGISKCSCDYILTLDADEVLGKDKFKLKGIIAKYSDVDAFNLQGDHYMFDLTHIDTSVKKHYWLNRLFKNKKALRYPENQHGLITPKSNITICGDFIHHYGNCKNMCLALRRYNENAGDKNEWPESQKQQREDYLKWQLFCMITRHYPTKIIPLTNHPKTIQEKFHTDDLLIWRNNHE